MGFVRVARRAGKYRTNRATLTSNDDSQDYCFGIVGFRSKSIFCIRRVANREIPTPTAMPVATRMETGRISVAGWSFFGLRAPCGCRVLYSAVYRAKGETLFVQIPSVTM
jgi:hypothetical protein